MKLRILFISIEGNTRRFVEKLTAYAQEQYPEVELETAEISDASPDADETEPFFALVPTYLDGGNGIDNGVKESLTNALGEYLDYNDNAQHLIGVVGSGNRNFNMQYILTARRYAERFNAPVIGDYELRGTSRDVERIFTAMLNRLTAVENELSQA